MSAESIEHFMTRHPHFIRAGETLDEALRLMTQVNCHHLPVLDDGRLVGIISDRDIRIVRVDPRTVKVEDVLTDDPLQIDMDTSLSTAAAMMADRHVSSLLVTDEGRLVGIFTSTDACRALATLSREGEGKEDFSRTVDWLDDK